MKAKIILEIEEAKEVLEQINKESKLYKKILHQIVNAEGNGTL